MAAIFIGALILGLAAGILFRRARQFIRSKGASACSNCPYSGNCSGGCGKKT